MNAAARDRLLSMLTLVFAVTYVSQARAIEDSLLADAVGAGGVPQGVGIAIGVAAVALFAKTWARKTVGGGAGAQPEGSERSSGAMDEAGPMRTAGLVMLLLGYAAVLPWAGYVLSVITLLLTSGWLAGAPLRLPLIATAGLGGPLLWFLFDRLLQVSLPVGRLWGG
jgi:putative tricarboxylic transport membrane protein